MSNPILREGWNCWRRARAERVAVLVDGASYFEALAAAIERAERQILMVGWDFHSRVRLRRDADSASDEDELLALLERQVRRRRSLRVRILAWDFAMIYALEREWQPLYRFDWTTHRHISFRLDAEHPVGASQHQKIVVVDDALAFSGGLDVTVCRWDTSEHADEDSRRSDPGFERYEPFHDVQLAVDGDAALALSQVVRERWKWATGRTLRPVGASRGNDPWPSGLQVRMRNVEVGISRTLPAHAGRAEVREVERLYVDCLRAAERSIYLENQYFTAECIAATLEERLAETDGLEVVVVLPSRLSGWLEARTMGVLADRVVRRLREADVHGRLRVLRPVLPGGAQLCIHAKVTVIDDRLLRVGSANASNRSMGLDSECDLSVESRDGRGVSDEIRATRDGLLAEHLGRRPEEVAEAVRRTGSLVAAIDALATGDRRLEPVPEPEPDPGWVAEALADRRPYDPEEPMGFEDLWRQFTQGRDTDPGRAGRLMPGVRLALGIAAIGGLLVAWNVTPLAQSLDPQDLARRISGFGDDAAGVSAVVALFALASSLLLPVTALIAASGMVFGFAKGAGIGLAGSLLGAALGYGAGRLLWRDAVRRLAGRRLDRISRRIARRGVLSAAALRVVPVAPFGVVNVVVGATHIRARDFLLGTLLGMAPGTLALAFFGERALAAFRNPSFGTLAAAVAVLALLVAAGKLVERRLSAPSEPVSPSPR